MPDREKVIKEYEEFVDKYECFSSSDDYVLEMHKAVLAMLKKQEPKRAIRGEAEDLPGIAFWVCPSCRIGIDYLDRFCRHCGQEIKWE